MLKQWRALSPGDRLRYQAVIGFLVLGIYGAVFYPVSHRKYFDAERMLSRRLNRIEARADISNIATQGGNPKILEKKIVETEEKLRQMEAQLQDLDVSFAPVDEAEVRQQMILEITSLAERTGFTLGSIVRKGFSPEAGEVGEVKVDPILGRPLLVIQADGSYGSLLAFLSGFKDLSFHTSVMRFSISSYHLKGRSKTGNKGSGRLSVSLEVSI